MCFFQWINVIVLFFIDKFIENNVVLFWFYQYCMEWGCFFIGDIFKDVGFKFLVFCLIDDDYNCLICKYVFGIEIDFDLEVVFFYGGCNFLFFCVVYIGGQFDNWGIMLFVGYMDQEEDLQQMGNMSEFKIFMKGVGYGWDFFGILDDEEYMVEYFFFVVIEVQKEIVCVVKVWVVDFKRLDEGCY